VTFLYFVRLLLISRGSSLRFFSPGGGSGHGRITAAIYEKQETESTYILYAYLFILASYNMYNVYVWRHLTRTDSKRVTFHTIRLNDIIMDDFRGLQRRPRTETPDGFAVDLLTGDGRLTDSRVLHCSAITILYYY